MAENDIYTKGILRINELRRLDISLDVINELQNLYHEFRIKRDSYAIDDIKKVSSDIIAKRNGYEFLMNQIRYTFFYLIRDYNQEASNGAIRRLENILDDNQIDISDLVTINNHALVIGKNDKKKAIIYDEYLQDITGLPFSEKNDIKYVDEKYIDLLNKIIVVLNQILDEIKVNHEEELKIFIKDNKIYYSNDNFHIYVSSNLSQIYNIYYGTGEFEVEVFIENNADEYALFEMIVGKNRLEYKRINYDIWKLSEANHNAKKMNKSLESYAIRK